jgi:hypothetical protein
VRRLVHERRERIAAETKSAPALRDVARVASDVAYQRRPPAALIDALDGRQVRPLKRA